MNNLIELWTLLLAVYAIYRIETMPKGLLSYRDLVRLVKTGVINAELEHVNATSIDIRFDNKILVEDENGSMSIEVDITNGYWVQPCQFILASSAEFFNLPDNISAGYKLKSSLARSGFEHLNAGWCDAGWHGSKLTLEFLNVRENGAFFIKAGNKAGQIVFFEHERVPDHASYAKRGQYNGQKEVTASKGVR